MSIKDRKERESAELRQQILSAAMRIFADQGYGNVSMRKIAAEIEYSPTTIYRFFRNKEDLLGAMALETYKELSARFGKIKEKDGGNPLELLKSLLKEYIAFCIEQSDMFRLFSDIASFEMEDGVIYEKLGGKRFIVYQSWLAAIERAIETGDIELKDNMQVFLYLWDSVNGYIDHKIKHTSIRRKPLQEDSDEYLKLLFRGIEKQANN